MRKIAVIIMIVGMLFNRVSVRALEPVDPYILTTAINALPVDKLSCQVLIQEQNQLEEDEHEDKGQMVALQEQLTQLEVAYQELNQRIQSLEQDEEYSIEAATRSLEAVIEQLYQNYMAQDAAFAALSEEEQLAKIQADDTVVEWQQFLEKIKQEQQEAIAERERIEADYKQLVYQLDQQTSQAETIKETSDQLNQCLLYAYSVPSFPIEAIFLNPETPTLAEYLAQLDIYLQKLVPYPYRKVSFDNIHQAFAKRLSKEALEASLYGKQNIVIDPIAVEQYSYEKELSILDVEIMAHLAQRDMLHSLNEDKYQQAYEAILQLKEAQFSYFTALNPQVWSVIKQSLAKYLNERQLWDEASILQMQQLHARYQLKLVVFNDVNRQWQPVENESGYLASHQQLSLQESEMTTLDATVTTLETITTKDNLAYLKEKLAAKQEKAKDSTLPRPSDTTKTLATSDKNKKTGNIKLPSTGEQQQATFIALILLCLGSVLLLITRIKKRNQRETLDKIELD